MTLLTRKQAAEWLGVSEDTLDVERRAGRIAYIQSKPGGKVQIREDALEEYLARSTHEVRPERTNIVTYRKRRA